MAYFTGLVKGRGKEQVTRQGSRESGIRVAASTGSFVAVIAGETQKMLIDAECEVYWPDQDVVPEGVRTAEVDFDSFSVFLMLEDDNEDDENDNADDTECGDADSETICIGHFNNFMTPVEVVAELRERADEIEAALHGELPASGRGV